MKNPNKNCQQKTTPPYRQLAAFRHKMKFPSPLNRHFFTKIRGNDVKVIIRLAESGWVRLRWSGIPESLVGGWTNPSEKYESNWIISPNRGENRKSLKPPTGSQSLIFRLDFSVWFDVHPFFFWWSADLVTSDLRCLVIYLSSWTASAGRHFWLVRSNQRFFSSNQLNLMRISGWFAATNVSSAATSSPWCGPPQAEAANWTAPSGLMARARFLFTSCLLNHSRRSSSRWIGDLYSWPIQDTLPATGRHPNIANSYLILHIIYATSRVSLVSGTRSFLAPSSWQKWNCKDLVDMPSWSLSLTNPKIPGNCMPLLRVENRSLSGRLPHFFGGKSQTPIKTATK